MGCGASTLLMACSRPCDQDAHLLDSSAQDGERGRCIAYQAPKLLTEDEDGHLLLQPGYLQTDICKSACCHLASP